MIIFSSLKPKVILSLLINQTKSIKNQISIDCLRKVPVHDPIQKSNDMFVSILISSFLSYVKMVWFFFFGIFRLFSAFPDGLLLLSMAMFFLLIQKLFLAMDRFNDYQLLLAKLKMKVHFIIVVSSLKILSCAIDCF